MLAGGCATPEDPALAAATTAYTNGRWYDGERFVDRPAFVRDGTFVETPRAAAGATIDLKGGYVLPAFAEAHHHTVICEPGRIKKFIDAGVLYAAIMAASNSTRECQGKMHGPGSVEVVTALAGITAPNAHPTQIGLRWLKPEELDGVWVYLVESAADTDRIWPRIEEMQPDFLKIVLSYSEDYARLRDDPSIASWYRGLDPSLVAPIVERAHASNLRVAAHVMSAHDFEVAVDGGVDIIAHMPGFAPGAAFTGENDNPYFADLAPDSPRYRISSAAAARAAAKGVAVVTTLSGGPAIPPAAAANVETLRAANLTLLIGSDRGEFNSVDEAIYLVRNGILPAADAVRSLAQTTPQFFFPDRKVGALSEGGEATFVVLSGDPLAEIDRLRSPTWVIQRGKQLRPTTE
jgi:imidazolonepropionase-like amidohydrolase